MFYGEMEDEYEMDKMLYPDVFDEEDEKNEEIREDFGFDGAIGLWN